MDFEMKRGTLCVYSVYIYKRLIGLAAGSLITSARAAVNPLIWKVYTHSEWSLIMIYSRYYSFWTNGQQLLD